MEKLSPKPVYRLVAAVISPIQIKEVQGVAHCCFGPKAS